MKLKYYSETNSLYIDLSERPSTESREISDGVVLDYDDVGRLVGIDIDNVRNKVELGYLTLTNFPGKVERDLPEVLSSSRRRFETPIAAKAPWRIGRSSMGPDQRDRAHTHWDMLDAALAVQDFLVWGRLPW